MADQETPQPAAEGENAEGAASAAKPGKLPLIGGIVAGLAVGSALGLFVLGPKLAPASPAPTGAHAQATEKKDGGAEHGEKKGGEASPVYQIDNLVLNPSGSNGTRFLLLSVALEVKNDAAVEMLKGHDAAMRDLILRLFGAKTAEQVAEASQRDGLRSEVMKALGKMFPAGTIDKVYFPQFVIQ